MYVIFFFYITTKLHLLSEVFSPDDLYSFVKAPLSLAHFLNYAHHNSVPILLWNILKIA